MVRISFTYPVLVRGAVIVIIGKTHLISLAPTSRRFRMIAKGWISVFVRIKLPVIIEYELDEPTNFQQLLLKRWEISFWRKRPRIPLIVPSIYKDRRIVNRPNEFIAPRATEFANSNVVYGGTPEIFYMKIDKDFNLRMNQSWD